MTVQQDGQLWMGMGMGIIDNGGGHGDCREVDIEPQSQPDLKPLSLRTLDVAEVT